MSIADPTALSAPSDSRRAIRERLSCREVMSAFSLAGIHRLNLLFNALVNLAHRGPAA